MNSKQEPQGGKGLIFTHGADGAEHGFPRLLLRRGASHDHHRLPLMPWELSFRVFLRLWGFLKTEARGFVLHTGY